MTDPSQTPPDTPAEKPAAADQAARQAPRFATRTLSHRKPTRFDWKPDASARRALAQALDLPGIGALRLKGEILPEGRDDFRLEARLEADVTQACVITLAPVPARITETVIRRYMSGWEEPNGEEVEIPEDDSVEAMPESIDIAEVTREALSLALPPYPRADGAALGEAVFAADGEAPLRDQDLRPFAGLAALLPVQPAAEPSEGPIEGENDGPIGGQIKGPIKGSPGSGQ